MKKNNRIAIVFFYEIMENYEISTQVLTVLLKVTTISFVSLKEWV